MTFRQNEIFLKQYAFCTLVMTVLTVITIMFTETMFWPMLIGCTACGLSCFMTWRTEPMIKMDEHGVRCTQRDKLLWDLSWSQIAEVRKSSHLRNRAILLIPTEEPKQDLHTHQNPLFLGFQLSRKAKNALHTYCPGLRSI